MIKETKQITGKAALFLAIQDAKTAILYSDCLESDQEINVLDMQLKHCEYIPNYYLKDHHKKLTDIRERLNILIERAR
jgi:hypothetical protein